VGRRKKGNAIHGWINIYKPAGMGSTDVVRTVKRALKPQKIGHGGTLDPLAEGILPLALGEATKTIHYCQDALKTYIFRVKWGQQTTTDDAEGDVIYTSDVRPSAADIDALLPQYHGDISQVPPQFSAVKIDGQRAYDLAREGESVTIEPRNVYIEKLTVTDHTETETTFECRCGKGTYIRSLARDMARDLGTFGHVSFLKRASVGPLNEKSAISLDVFEKIDHSADLDTVLLPVETMLDDILALALNETEAARLRNGQSVTFVSRPDVQRLYDAGLDTLNEVNTALVTCKGKPVAITEIAGTEISPSRVFNL